MAEEYLQEARTLFQKAVEELKKAREDKDYDLLRDACGKGWLSALEATYAYLIKKGVKEEELSKTDRGRRFMVDKYAEKELRLYYFYFRERLHIEGYYEGVLGFEEVERVSDDLDFYIKKIEEI